MIDSYILRLQNKVDPDQPVNLELQLRIYLGSADKSYEQFMKVSEFVSIFVSFSPILDTLCVVYDNSTFLN